MADFWEQDKPVTGGSGADDAWWEADKPAARQDLPAGVKPSTAEGGRGRVNPPTVAEQGEDLARPSFRTASPAGSRRIEPARKPVSVMEGVDIPPPTVSDAQEAENARLSNRAYAERTPTLDDPRNAAPSMRESNPAPVNPSVGLGSRLVDAPLPVRAAAKAVTQGVQGMGGVVRAAGDLAGSSAVSDFGRNAVSNASAFEEGMGRAQPVEGFGPKSPLPYLKDMGEGAASSLLTSAGMATTFGARAVIPLMSIQQAGQTYDDARNAGRSPAAAIAYAVPYGTFEAIGEKYQGLDKAAQALRILMTKGAPREAVQSAGEALLRAGIREIPGEVITYLGQSGMDALPGIGLKPDMTVGQWLDGLRDTVVQAGMMGATTAAGGVAAGARVGRERPQQSAEQIARDKGFLVQQQRIDALKTSGEKAVADTLQRRLDTEKAGAELDALADRPYGKDPEFQQQYRTLRSQGVAPAEASARAAMIHGFTQMATQSGLTPKAVEAALQAAAKKPLDEVPAFLEKYTASLAQGGMGKALPQGTVADAVGAVRDDAMNAAIDNIAGILGVDAPPAKPEAAAPQEAAVSQQAETVSQTAPDVSRGAEFDTGNDVAVTPEADAAHAAATSPLNDLPEPTEAQKKAGNYKVGRLQVGGLDISVENPQGSVRRGVGADGTPWETAMRDHYGYIKGTVGADKDHVDVFVKPGTPADYRGPVFVVDQVDPATGRFDEHKVVLGAADRAEAEAVYRRNYGPDWQGLGAITELPMPAFKAWATSNKTKRLHPDKRIKRVEGGFALVPKSRAQLQAEAKAARRLGAGPVGKKGVPLAAHEFVAGEGGLRREEMADAGFDRNVKVGSRWLFAAPGKGMTIEQATQALIQDGYLPHGALHNDAYELIRRSVTDPQYTPEGWERIAQAERETRFDDYLQAQQPDDAPPEGFTPDELETAGYERASADVQAEVRALLQLLEAEGIDAEALLEDVARNTENATEQTYYEHAKQALESALAAQRGSESHRGAPAGEPGPAREQRGSEEPRGDTRGSPDRRAPEGELTETPARAGVSASEARETDAPYGAEDLAGPAPSAGQQAAAKAKSERQQKDQDRRNAAPDAGDFTLTGSDRAADEAEARGQQTLFEPERDYAEPYETDLFGNPVPRQQSLPDAGSAGRARAESARAEVRGNAQPAAAVPGEQRTQAGGDAAAGIPGQYFVDTFVSTETRRKVGTDHVRTPAELAQATRYLYRSAVERFDAIVTDKAGKVLAVVGSFKGATTQTSVYPGTLVAEALRVPGAAHIWFSHNHPSGTATLSTADVRLSATLADVFKGSGIRPMGVIAVSGEKFSFHSDSEHQNYVGITHTIPQGGTPTEVPVYERELADQRQFPVAISSPLGAIDVARTFYTKAKEDGLMLLDAQNNVSGWLPMGKLLAGKLRDTGGLALLYRAISRSNASAAILVHGGALDRSPPPGMPGGPILNIGKALQQVDVRMLDAISFHDELRPSSRAQNGLPLVGTSLYARGGEAALRRSDEKMLSGLTMEEARAQVRALRGASVTQAREIVDGLTATWKNGPKITVVATAADLPGDNPADVRGLYEKGHIWIVAGAHRAGPTLRRSLARTLAHEAVAHFGLRDLLGREGWNHLMTNISRAIAAGNKPLQAIQKFVRETYVNADGSFALSQAQEADEIAAKAVEEAIDENGNFRPGFGFFKAVWAAIAQKLRAIGINVTFTNHELQGMLVLAMRNMERGQRTTGGAAVALAAAREDGPMHHRAFHGSPHDFNAFTTEKIGTGEGAQAYGWGLYFAENEGVAESYRKTLSGQVMVDGKPINRMTTGTLNLFIADMFKNRKGAGLSDEKAREQTAEWAKKHFQIKTLGAEKIDAYVNSMSVNQGRVYEVHITDEVVGKMLLWDKPLSEQPDPVKKALREIIDAEDLTKYRLALRGVTPAERSVTGEAFYRFLAEDMLKGGREAASKELDAVGIPGIRYLDGGSRNRPLRTIKREFLAQLPEDADFEEVKDLIGTGAFSPENDAILKALAADDWLGFDYPSQALSAALSSELSNFDPSPALLKAVEDARKDATYNLVVFNEKNVTLTHKDGTPVTKQERADFMDGAQGGDAFDGAQHARGAATTADQQPAAAPAVPRPLSLWRDATGRLQFAPGQVLYNLIGKAADPMLTALQLKAASPPLRRALREMKNEVRKAQETAAKVAGESNKLTPAERAMVSDLIEKELAADTIPPEHAVRLAALINDVMGKQTDELVRLGMLEQDSAERWRGQYLPRYYESKLTKKAADAWATAIGKMMGRPRAMRGISGKHLKGRGLYETIPESQLAQYETMGWEVRDPDYTPGLPTTDGTVQVWRDFTRAERDKMGEIRDAGFRFVMGYMQTQRDIALGRMFEALAADPTVSSRTASEKFSVRVPTSIVEGTGAKTYGRLAGRYVSKDTLSHLSAVEEAQSEVLQMYRKAMGWWKLGKTALNPVSHMNNILSNLTMAHFAGVSYWEAHKYAAAAIDLARNTAMVKEANEAGLFGGTLSETELLNMLPPELAKLARTQEGLAPKVGRTAFDILTFFLRRPMGWAYQAEDSFFRYLLYRDARGRGMPAADAVDWAQRFIFAYDDLPKGARMVRDFGIPFFSYTYKAAPALLHTALTHPVRFAAPAAVLWAANAAAYAIAAGDDDDDWEERLRKYLTDAGYRKKARELEEIDREHLPPWLKGTTALLSPKALRLGMDEVTKLPLFIDISRIIPGGDLFDVSPNAGGLPIPQPITPSHPLFTTAVAMIGNKDLFFGKEIVDSNDTRLEATQKRADWIWKQLSPAIAFGNYHWERGMNALAQATGHEVRWLPEQVAPNAEATGMGRDGLPVQPKLAALQTVGIKVRPIDIDKSVEIEESMRKKMVRDIDTELRRLKRLYDMGAISDKSYDRARDLADTKKDRLKDGLTVDGEKRD